MKIAELIRARQNTKAMTARAIFIARALGDDPDEIAALIHEYERLYDEKFPDTYPGD